MKCSLTSFYSSNFLLIALLVTLFTSCKKEEPQAIQLKELNSAYFSQQKGDSLLALGLYEKAFNNYLTANWQFKDKQKDENITYNNLQIATIYLTIGDPNSAQELLTHELTTIDTQTNDFKVFLYNALANCYVELNDHALANKYYSLSLELASNEQAKAIIQNNIALNKIILKEYDDAISILQKINNSKVLENAPLEQARILNNLGKAQYLQNPKQGLQELEQALAIRQLDNNQKDLFRSYIALAEYYLLNKDYNSSHFYAQKAYQNTVDLKNKKERLQALEYLIKSQSSNNTIFFNEYIELSKDIYMTNQQAKNQFAKIRYDFEQHEQENTKLKHDLQHSELLTTRKDNTILILLMIAILASVSISYAYRKMKQKHRKEKIEQTYKTEISIAKKIHDELANDVFNVLTFTQNFNLEVEQKKNQLIYDLDNIYKKARNISLQHNAISTGTTFKKQLTELFNEYNSATCQIILTGLDKISFEDLDHNQKITIYRVVQELLINMKKHSMATLVVFKFIDDKKNLHIFYSDNGVGIIQENINSKNGLANVENRITNIGGTFIFDKENAIGVKYNILLPKKNYV
ncbi:MAG: histidine kinase [Flavobacteriaceae bacterium]|jgi:signal transduction histidine kinase/uncharacterized glyoxalase superfamily protein PhnB|nr:histidine kinase [Flavobacteriaceae bacterium]